MDILFFHPVEYERLYNCSAYKIDQIPLQQRQHILLGSIFIVLGIFFMALYIPCTIAIKKHMDSTCFKFMFYVAVADMLSLPLCTFVNGYLMINGSVFCSSPTFIYIGGAYGLAMWVLETTIELFLAFNRCVAMLSDRIEHLLFNGIRFYIWIAFATLYGLYFFIFTKPLVFSGVVLSWFFNPHIGYINDDSAENYSNFAQFVHNCIIFIFLSGTYFLFALILCIKFKQVNATSAGSNSTISQKMIFLQVVLISFVNMVSASVYTIMNFVALNKFLIIFGQLGWIFSHGIPPLIYLWLNKTVRRDVLNMVPKRALQSTTAAG